MNPSGLRRRCFCNSDPTSGSMRLVCGENYSKLESISSAVRDLRCLRGLVAQSLVAIALHTPLSARMWVSFPTRASLSEQSDCDFYWVFWTAAASNGWGTWLAVSYTVRVSWVHWATEQFNGTYYITNVRRTAYGVPSALIHNCHTWNESLV